MTTGRRSLAAKEIDAQSVARSCPAGVNGSIRDLHRSIPDVSSAIDSRRNLQTRVSLPAFLVMRLFQIDVEVNPFTLPRDFELLVAFDIVEVGAVLCFRL
jgi:hypothetical protein